MTTDKRRLTIYLTSDAALEALYQDLRTLAPIAQRGQISRSTIAEAALALAWQDVQANGPAAAIFSSLVTLPEVNP
mgnify:CR=1 FL=1